ncbi:hypothetical protein DUI87_20366 [Hirundo rustica rustica]|uniref:Uncharacterized protein n=1 Tax=Hirundo rustica rustica TaxID=333673 RepID=A0A3M0JQ69_HIRRU|nr:hypothetical protein DUI87_20366 [Hirundo rustica rustica]
MLNLHSDINGGFFPRVVTTHQPYANVPHQEVQVVHLVKTLNDAQKLGDSDLKSPCTLTSGAHQVLEEVQRAVSARQVYHIDPSVDVTVFITTPDLHPTGIIGQRSDKWSDSLHALEWVFLPHQLQKTATTLFELIVI